MIRFLPLLLVSSCFSKIKQQEEYLPVTFTETFNQASETVKMHPETLNFHDPICWFAGIISAVIFLSFFSKIFKK